MKKLLLIAMIALSGCSAENTEEQNTNKCYPIISRGEDNRGNYIIINYSSFIQKRYKVANFMNWLDKTELCEPITLTEQPL